MRSPLLEVIALDAADAAAAEAGGADRLEVVTGMDRDGLTPSAATVAAIRAATRLPLRVMLRGGEGFRTDRAEVANLRAAAVELAAAGADAFVLGFLDPDGDPDLPAMAAVSTATDLPWTCHRAIDHARDREAAWRQVRGLPGLDTVLTAGSPRGVGEGLPWLVRQACDPADAGLILAGGGLRPDQVPSLVAAGVLQLHVGSRVRPEGSWAAPVDPAQVRAWRVVVDSAAG
ncbi:copper homeostasis protein CutC [Nocardioides guangzhouensis]|uniref:Copper homeostasis protein cutC homolog n=1 Tax=Nocardioides guangzhouensis TaxID=2497878 RepID=A0A4Q4ZID0_9ACTN|nr:copper homeostasis protein CutC [Nocardioides guangzhouensis]RYP88002.1 copper homeostasis protein CutC [Nocardioides guangzhouensis]